MKIEYKIGEIAAHFGISRELLRHYDKLGLLTPHKNEHNGYRVYNRADFICLGYIRDLSKMGIPLNEIKAILRSDNVDKDVDILKARHAKVAQQINELQELLFRIEDYQKGYHNTAEFMQRIHSTSGESIIYQIIDDASSSLLTVMENFKHRFPGRVPRFTFICSHEQVMDKGLFDKLSQPHSRGCVLVNALSLIMDNSTNAAHIKQQGLLINSPKAYLYTIAKVIENQDYSSIIRIQDYIRANYIETAGDMFVRVISLSNQMKKNVDYYEIWIPIK